MMKGILKKLYWRILRLVGCERTSWNDQYVAGVWSGGNRSGHTVALVAELCAGGKMAEFGCGEGELPHLLPPGCFSEYLGIDVSDIAIRRATTQAAEAGFKNCRFQQGDMANWEGTEGLSLVLAEECLYYLNPKEIKAFLSRVCDSLVETGKILVVVHDALKHKRTLEACRLSCDVVTEQTRGNRVYLVLARRSLHVRDGIPAGDSSVID